ncbi:hypothetical protein ZWY2020_006610 [Hordeum vulgare]|nr:hypothetical protein ZWY2020_006610 [Hordeum vulgare]
MASYHFLIQQLSGPFEGCEFHHVPRAENEAADTLAKIGSTRQAIPADVSLEQLHKPSIKPSPESASIFVPADSQAPPAPPVTPAADPLAGCAGGTGSKCGTDGMHGARSSTPPTTPATEPIPTPLVQPTPIAAPATTTTPALFGLESSQWVDVMEVDGEPAEPAAVIAPEIPSGSGAAEASNGQDEAEATLVSAPSWAQAILAFLLCGELPQNEAEVRQIQCRSAAYTIINRKLVRRSTTGVFQRCVESEKG